MTYALLVDATGKPDELDRDLDLPLPWELDQEQASALARRRTAERNQAGQQKMMTLMKAGKKS